MATLSIPEGMAVTALVLYTGISTGWHVGKAMTWVDQRRRHGTAWLLILRKGFWRAGHHYDLGLIVATVGLALLVGWPPVERVAGWALLGFGLGMAYDDRADHPPGGIVRHMVGRVRGATS